MPIIQSECTDQPVIVQARPPAGHMRYLDGIRGIAALGVVLSHAYGESTKDRLHPVGYEVIPPIIKFMHFLLCGHFAVVVFLAFV